MQLSRLLLLSPVLFAAACSSGASDGREPMGSQTMVVSSDYSALYVAVADSNTIARIDMQTQQVTPISIDGEPVRMARAGTTVFATLRALRKLAVFDDVGGALVHRTSVEVGAEPFGVVASSDGRFVYVASSMSHRVDELDGTTFQVVRSWEVSDEPRWLALHPSSEALYVGSARNGRLTWIDLSDPSGTLHDVPLPRASGRFLETGMTFEVAQRITGDITVTPDGENLLVPMMYIDNRSPIPTPGEGDTAIPPSGGYDSGRLNPTVAIVPVDVDGAPDLREIDVISVTAFMDVPVVGYPASVTPSPDSDIMLVSIEGSSGVVAVPIDGDDEDFGDAPPNAGRSAGPIAAPPSPDGTFREGTQLTIPISHRTTMAVRTPAGATSVAFISDEEAYVFSFLDREVAKIPVADVEEGLDSMNGDVFDEIFGGGSDRFDHAFGFQTQPAFEIGERVFVNEQVDRGRRLFYAADDQRVSSSGSGVSCATCHFDARDDGLTWHFEHGPRQTPSLAGPVSMTAPVGWEGNRATVAIDAEETSEGLMGGSGMSEADSLAIEAFIDWTRDVDVDRQRLAADSVERGQAIFGREDVGCAGCHLGERLTDNLSHAAQDAAFPTLKAVQTPSLVGIAATAPYLHDGSAPTLRAVLEVLRNSDLGNTSMLSEEELSDLETYLRSL